MGRNVGIELYLIFFYILFYLYFILSFFFSTQMRICVAHYDSLAYILYL